MTHALSYDDVMKQLPAIIADCLAVEVEDVAPAAGFFTELGGDSIDLLDLSFRCEKAFGIRAPFRLLHGSRDQLDDGEYLTAEALRLMRETYPFYAERLDHLRKDKLQAQDLKDQFTVDAIARFVLLAAETAAANPVPAA